MKMIGILRILLFAGMVSALFATGSHAQRPQVPDMSMNTIDGKPWKLSELRGKVVIINFWATWCEPCRTEVPYLVKLGSEHRQKGLAVAGIALDEDPAIVKKFIAEYKVDYPILFPDLASPWRKIDNTPTTLLIDRTGRLAKKYTGAVPEQALRRDTEALLAEK
jgi:thiol-disulfide isomerase/thioredoxin